MPDKDASINKVLSNIDNGADRYKELEYLWEESAQQNMFPFSDDLGDKIRADLSSDPSWPILYLNYVGEKFVWWMESHFGEWQARELMDEFKKVLNDNPHTKTT